MIRFIFVFLTLIRFSHAYTWSNDWEKIIITEVNKYPTIMNWDASLMCPNYRTDKNKFWHYFFRAIIRAESGYNPGSMYVENLGKDMVTRNKIVSEGLFQLSYQDSVIHGCAFDWSKDKSKDDKDLTRTILIPKNNIACGVKIFNKQLEKRKAMFTEKPYYWAVLTTTRPGYKIMRKYFDANLGKWCQP